MTQTQSRPISIADGSARTKSGFGMGQRKLRDGWANSTAQVLAVIVLCSVPLRGQEQPSITNQDGSILTKDQPFVGEQSDPTRQRQLSNVPDDIGYQLQESEDRVDAIFPVGPMTPLHNVWDHATEHLRDNVYLDLGLNYTSVYQRADTTVRGPRDARRR